MPASSRPEKKKAYFACLPQIQEEVNGNINGHILCIFNKNVAV